jgi:hypothetical protein
MKIISCGRVFSNTNHRHVLSELDHWKQLIQRFFNTHQSWIIGSKERIGGDDCANTTQPLTVVVTSVDQAAIQ